MGSLICGHCVHYERGALPGLSKRSYCVDGENHFLVLSVLESIPNLSIAKIGLSKVQKQENGLGLKRVC
ncbi:unnamed protein product [Sphagnum jensenii]|uniref:Uncharacterized protein n=1 Tax=Sphagnum jensenii TaxID=128206 RepID=A0ABP1ADV3_9BRYO